MSKTLNETPSTAAMEAAVHLCEALLGAVVINEGDPS